MAALRLISTDFDGTLHEDLAREPVPIALQDRLRSLQRRGVTWVINTGRDLSSLLEVMARAKMTVQPDFIVAVEREIYRHDGTRYVPLEPWNSRCVREHFELFSELAPDLNDLVEKLSKKFEAQFYSDPWSPLCAIARDNRQMDQIQAELDLLCQTEPEVTSVRNDVYLRLSHRGFSKGTALAEIAREIGSNAAATFAVGDHFNDLSMLKPEFAAFLATPANAIPPVKSAILEHRGFIASLPCGNGVLQALDHFQIL